MSPWAKDFLEDFKKNGMMVMTGAVMLSLLCFITYAAVYIELKNKEIVLMLFGSIVGYAGGVLSYYYGSSKGSADKTKIMADKSNTSE